MHTCLLHVGGMNVSAAKERLFFLKEQSIGLVNDWPQTSSSMEKHSIMALKGQKDM